ncbi:MAG: T9SS type A sorting domain-containing protein, partial [Caldithrix sp.]|nr:T9SS type A sorting domain-containing protein [Caldithrix sp.]
HVHDPDDADSDMEWTYSGNTDLNVTIDANRVATVSAPNEDWNGSETITFTATDPGGLSDDDAAVFTVTAVNDAPVVSDIPDQTTDEGQNFDPILLDDYVSDVDNTDADMDWTHSGNTNLTVTIDANRVATVSAPDEDWNGSETITFKTTDPDGLSDNDAAVFTVSFVNDAPVIDDTLPELTFKEDSELYYDISNWYPYVTDADNPDSTLNYQLHSATDTLTVVNEQDQHLISALGNWFGMTMLKLVVSDGTSADSADVSVQVQAVNDAPQIVDIPDTTYMDAGDTLALNLAEFESDVDTPGERLNWQLSTEDTVLQIVNSNEPKMVRMTCDAQTDDTVSRLFMTLTDDSAAAARDTLLVKISKKVTALTFNQPVVPRQTELYQNYPNPFNPRTHLRFYLAKPSHVTIDIYNTVGQKLITLVDDTYRPGQHTVVFDGGNLPSGLYLYRLQTDNKSVFKKMILLK